jgi:hypothetical protein
VTEAARHASHIVAESYALGWVAKAISAAGTGNLETAQRAVNHLTALQPTWRENPRAELARVIADAAIVQRLSHDLAAAGLTERH